MNYVFDIFLTEEDYIDFNIFHMCRSAYGKKHQRLLRGMVAVIFAVAALNTDSMLISEYTMKN